MSHSTADVLKGIEDYGPTGEEPGPVVTLRYKAREGDHADHAETRRVRIIAEVWEAKSNGKLCYRVVHVDADGVPELETVTRKDGTREVIEATRTYRVERTTTAPVPLA